MTGRCDRCPAYGCTECPWALLLRAQKLLHAQERVIKAQEALLLRPARPPDPLYPPRRA